jgi:hypothetical protein
MNRLKLINNQLTQSKSTRPNKISKNDNTISQSDTSDIIMEIPGFVVKLVKTREELEGVLRMRARSAIKDVDALRVLGVTEEEEYQQAKSVGEYLLEHGIIVAAKDLKTGDIASCAFGYDLAL